jgi:hypothetical protein
VRGRGGSAGGHGSGSELEPGQALLTHEPGHLRAVGLALARVEEGEERDDAGELRRRRERESPRLRRLVSLRSALPCRWTRKATSGPRGEGIRSRVGPASDFFTSRVSRQHRSGAWDTCS